MGKKTLFKVVLLLSSFFTKLINRYIDTKNIHTPEYWRQFIYFSIFILMGILNLFIIIPNIILNLMHYNYFYVIIPAAAIISFFGMIFIPNISFKIRSVAGPFFLYLLGIYLIIAYGPDLDSFPWLFTFVMMISIFHTLKAAALASLLNLVSLIILGILQAKGIIQWKNIEPYPPLVFITGSVNFFTLNLIMAVAFNILLNRIYKSYVQMNQARDAIIMGLAKLAEYRDSDTGDHLERMKHYTRLLAIHLRECGYHNDYITDEYIEDLTISAILHDIGKVGVPDAILLKAGLLTEDEFTVIKQHPVFGKNVLLEIGKKVDYFSYIEIARAIAYYHHEKWDGTGYPEGLKGDEIPLSARIVALADVYDALRSKRVYKKAFSHKQAVEIIHNEKAKHFDPVIVEVFLSVEQEFMRIHNTYAKS